MEWISVNDRLPEENTRVFVYHMDCVLNKFGSAFFNGESFLFDATMINDYEDPEDLFFKVSDLPIKNVSHWCAINAFLLSFEEQI